MDKDVTTLTFSLDTWLPTKVSENLFPVVEKAELTNTQVNAAILNRIQKKITSSLVASSRVDAKIGNALEDRLIPLEASRDKMERGILDKIDLRLIPIESNISFRPKDLINRNVTEDCQVNLLELPKTVREDYHYLLMRNDRQRFCVLNGPKLGTNWNLFHDFSTWFRAYLALYLLQTHRIRPEKLDQYVERIEHTLLYENQKNLISSTFERFVA